MAPTFKGNTTTLVKRKMTSSTNGIIEQVDTWTGEKSALLDLGYVADGAITALDGVTSLKIAKVEIETHASGPYCALTVTSSNSLNGSGSAADTIYERSWMRIDKDIKTHRAWMKNGVNGATEDGTYPLTDEDWDKVHEWESDTTAAGRTAKYTALSTNAKQLAIRLRRGQTNYPIWVPVASQNKATVSKPPATPSIGGISDPPAQCNMPTNTANGKAYKYVKMADDMTRTGTHPWRQSEEWIGFDDFDALIYENK